MLDELISVVETEPEPEPEPDRCQPMMKPFPGCLANVRICNQMKEKAKSNPLYNQIVRKYKDICQPYYDDYEKFMKYQCGEPWCRVGRRNKQTWEKENNERCSGNTEDNKAFCDDVGRKLMAFLHLNCSTPITKGKYKLYNKDRKLRKIRI